MSDTNELIALVGRNCKLYFKDKATFFVSLITPMILLVLYVTFLGKTFEDTFKSSFPKGMPISDELIGGLVGGQLLSSLLSVCCVTVAFCSNMIMVTDKVTGARRDLTMTPVKSSVMSLAYYISTLINTLIVNYAALAVFMIYLGNVGWYMTVSDILLVMLDVFVITLFGTALSSVINVFLSTQGQISAVGTVVSAGYGFICGAYMPISQFSSTLKKILSFMPSTYSTSLLRNHSMRGALNALSDEGITSDGIENLRDSLDCNVYLFDEKVEVSTMLITLSVCSVLLIAAYILIARLRKNN